MQKKQAMKPKVYIETSVVSYLSGRLSRDVARALITNRLIPSRFPEDALHIAIAATHGMDYILTWNFKHLNNVQVKGQIADFVGQCGYEPPMVCSPDELFGELS